MPSISVGMNIEVLHYVHINIIKEASKHGEQIIGPLTDSAVANHKRLPHLPHEHRKRVLESQGILENINGVSWVVPQNEWDYAPPICGSTFPT